MKRKISPSCLQGKGWVTNSEYFIGGSILLSKGGSVQVSVKGYQSIVENEFRSPLHNLVNRLNKATDKEKRLEIFHRILEIHKRIHQSKLVWERFSPYEE